MSTSKATPRPWNNNPDYDAVYDARGGIIMDASESDQPSEDGIANAALIVQAVNSYEPMLEALRDVVKRSAFAPATGGMTVFHTFEQIKRIQQALALAEGPTS